MFIHESTMEPQVKIDERTATRAKKIAHAVLYELAYGIHTYSYCSCGRPTRTGKCYICQTKEFLISIGELDASKE